MHLGLLMLGAPNSIAKIDPGLQDGAPRPHIRTLKGENFPELHTDQLQ
ncbi:MAG: hypothetical protein NVSMB9_37120 [Isosphaeraceae bacterium]